VEKEKYYVVGAYWNESTPKDQTGRFIHESIWENGYTDKFLDEVNKIPINGHIAIKSAYTKEKTKSVMLIKARGIVTKNHKNGRLLDIEWEDDFTPFEVNFSGGYWNTVSEVKKQAHIRIIWSEQTNTEEVETEKETEKKCLSPLNQILFGPPGTGKTYHTIDKSVEIANNKRYNEIFTIEDEKERRKELKKEFKKLKENNQIIFTTFHQSMSYEEFVEGLKPDVDKKTKEIFYEVKKGIFRRICIKAEENPTKNYVLIIDEINRGNIASVFGELITLIEPDKRKGEDEELFVELPYSKTEFTVPKNLYIIGTMNTADRSVEALDSALRRRFVFDEMPPNENLLKNDFYSINLQKVLEQINTRIEKLIDKDHKIGHSYFMKLTEISDLQNTFKNKLIPLLEEYFYGDFAKIGLILGKDFIKKENTEENIFKNIDNDEDYSDFESRIIYKIIVPNQEENFVDTVKNIYL
ncbi:MAG: AAA family ATPase, partial [Bacteroidota bacterium]|nr:AAA family ATPase [Bacteroidota bacterium]